MTRLRGTGHEDELMHLDLEVDHIARLVVASAFPSWDPLWLSDVQSRSITDFPVTPLHTPTSRARKASRYVSLRLDHLLRLHRPELVTGTRYAFAVFGEAATGLQAFLSGLPSRLLFETRLAASDVLVLFSAHDETKDPDLDPAVATDRVLRSML